MIEFNSETSKSIKTPRKYPYSSKILSPSRDTHSPQSQEH